MNTKSNAVANTVKEIAEVPSSAVPDYLRGKEMSGQGVSTKAADILIPNARVLQPLSPEVLAGPAQVPNAVAGDIFIKNAPVPLIKASEGFLFQPCHFSTAVVEWLPRSRGGGGGGGLVGKHTEWRTVTDANGRSIQTQMPADAVERPDPENAERKITVSSRTGNVYVDTRYHAGFVIRPGTDAAPMPCYIPLSSSGHSVSKAWMMLMSLKRLGASVVDSWAVYYRFLTTMRTKNNKSWFTFAITDAGEVENGQRTTFWAPTKEDFERGEALYKALEAGTVDYAPEETVADETAHAARGGDDIPF